MQVGARLQRQQVFFAVVVFGFGRRFVGHKTKPAVHQQRRVSRAQATLARQRHRRMGLQVQPHGGRATFGAGAHFAVRLPVHLQRGRLGVVVQVGFFQQPRKAGQRLVGLQAGASQGKSPYVQAVGIPCHFGVRIH